MRKAPYGYDKKGRHWEINKKEAFCFWLAFLMVAEGYTLTETAMQEIRESAEKNGVADMSLDEINAKIVASRAKRDAVGNVVTCIPPVGKLLQKEPIE